MDRSGEKDDVTDRGEGRRGYDEKSALMGTLGEHGDCDGEDCCAGIRGDGKQLSLGGGITELFNYGGLNYVSMNEEV